MLNYVDNVTEFSLGNDHSMMRKKNGSVWIWGDNRVCLIFLIQFFQLGDGTANTNYIPNEIKMENIQKFALGYFHSLLIQNGTLFAAGYNGVLFNELNHLVWTIRDK
jgi:alpha-tubulin suppressor-like RCC1 family protein